MANSVVHVRDYNTGADYHTRVADLLAVMSVREAELREDIADLLSRLEKHHVALLQPPGDAQVAPPPPVTAAEEEERPPAEAASGTRTS